MARARKQLQIVGTEAPIIEEIDSAAEDYRAFRDERMALAKKEKEASSRLLDEMKKHNLNSYNYEDGSGRQRKVTLVIPDSKISVKLIKEKSDDEGGDDAPDDEPNEGVEVS